MRTSMLTTIGIFGFIASSIPAAALADEGMPATTSVATSGPSGTVSKGASVWGILPTFSGIGVGGRFMLPLPIQPVLHSSTVKDTFALEFGADYLHWSYGYNFPGANFNYSLNELVPVVGMMWSFWLSDRFALYPKIELGYAIAWFSGWNNTYGSTPTATAFFWDLAAGALYKLGNGFTLRAEVGSANLKLGAGLLF